MIRPCGLPKSLLNCLESFFFFYSSLLPFASQVLLKFMFQRGLAVIRLGFGKKAEEPQFIYVYMVTTVHPDVFILTALMMKVFSGTHEELMCLTCESQ